MKFEDKNAASDEDTEKRGWGTGQPDKSGGEKPKGD